MPILIETYTAHAHAVLAQAQEAQEAREALDKAEAVLRNARRQAEAWAARIPAAQDALERARVEARAAHERLERLAHATPDDKES